MKSFSITKNSILTEREIEYLSLVALGYKNRIIANILFVSISTVKKTLENVFKKLHVRDRANAVAIAFIHQLITPVSLARITYKYNLNNDIFLTSGGHFN